MNEMEKPQGDKLNVLKTKISNFHVSVIEFSHMDKIYNIITDIHNLKNENRSINNVTKLNLSTL